MRDKRNDRCAKRLYDWGEASIPESDRFSFFEALGCDLEIVKIVLLLTGALHGTKTRVSSRTNLGTPPKKGGKARW